MTTKTLHNFVKCRFSSIYHQIYLIYNSVRRFTEISQFSFCFPIHINFWVHFSANLIVLTTKTLNDFVEWRFSSNNHLTHLICNSCTAVYRNFTIFILLAPYTQPWGHFSANLIVLTTITLHDFVEWIFSSNNHLTHLIYNPVRKLEEITQFLFYCTIHSTSGALFG